MLPIGSAREPMLVPSRLTTTRSPPLMSTQPSASAKPSWPYFRSSAEDRRKRRKAQDQKKRRRVEPLGKIKILEEVKGETCDRSPLPPTQGMSCVLAGHDRSQTRRERRQAAVISVADPSVRPSVRTEKNPTTLLIMRSSR